jgi:signal transduction histidine kinase
MSNNSFNKFMGRLRFHIAVMVFLSILFISAAALLLVTYVVQVLYRADKVRQVYLTKAARNSKMASIGQLAAGVAHEINNPLAIINEKAGLLMDLFSFLEEYKGDTRFSSAVQSIIRAVERAGTITHRLLGFARETDISIQTLNIKDTIYEVLGFVKKEAEYKSINIKVEIPDPFQDIISDRGKLQQILINLINNAIAALDEKGTLAITAKNNIKNKSIELYVKDNGCGISKDHQKKIFEPFFTTKAEIGGTGLGLALTYGLIRDMHGTLELESSPGIGTTFTITLPYKIKEIYGY